LINVLEQVVTDYAKDRPIIFSTFQPDAAILVRKLQSTYPVSFYAFLFRNFLTMMKFFWLLCEILTWVGDFLVAGFLFN